MAPSICLCRKAICIQSLSSYAHYLGNLQTKTSFWYFTFPNLEKLGKVIYSYSASIYMAPGEYETRGGFDFTYGIKPLKGMDFYLFARAFIGPDYYNLRHIYKRKAITLGIITDTMHMPIF